MAPDPSQEAAPVESVLLPSELLLWAGALALPALVISLVVAARAGRGDRDRDRGDPPE